MELAARFQTPEEFRAHFQEAMQWQVSECSTRAVGIFSCGTGRGSASAGFGWL
jgi:hypothetical protein